MGVEPMFIEFLELLTRLTKHANERNTKKLQNYIPPKPTVSREAARRHIIDFLT